MASRMFSKPPILRANCCSPTCLLAREGVFLSSVVVRSKICATQFATKTGCLSRECIHCNTVVLSVHMKVLLISSDRAFSTSFLSLAASNEACSSSFGIVQAFICATLSSPNTDASGVCSLFFSLTALARKNATALNTSCELSPNK